MLVQMVLEASVRIYLPPGQCRQISVHSCGQTGNRKMVKFLQVPSEGMVAVQEYMLSASHLFNEIAVEVFKNRPLSIGMLLHPQLKILEVNNRTLIEVLQNISKLNGIEILYLFLNIKKPPVMEWKFVQFVGSLTHLTKLKISNCCTDEFLAVLGANCKNLEVFDAEDDTEMLLTDNGLAFLSNCQKLKHVIFNDDGDEYDYEDRYFGMSGRGVAHLILSLSSLQKLVCEPYLLREALKFVYPITVNCSGFLLKYLHTRYPTHEFLAMACTLCPYIQELHLEEPAEDCAQILPRLKQLKKLILINYTWYVRAEPFYKTCFSGLKCLVLKNPKSHSVDIEFLKKIGRWCSTLKELHITLYHRDVISGTHIIKNEFFPELESLNLEGDVSEIFIDTMVKSVKQLRNLGICVHSLGMTNSHFDDLIRDILKSDSFKCLYSLHCCQWDVSVSTMLMLISSCECLRHIWGLDLLMLSPSEIAVIKMEIRSQNLNIELHDRDITEQRNGLPVL